MRSRRTASRPEWGLSPGRSIAFERDPAHARPRSPSPLCGRELAPEGALTPDVLRMLDGVVPDSPVSTVVDKFRGRDPGAPVVVRSGHLEDSVVLEGIARKDIQFLQKPFSVEAFFDVMDRALGPGG